MGELVEHLLSFRGELNEKQRAKLKLDNDAVPVSIGIDNSLSLITSLDAERPTTRQQTIASPNPSAGAGDSASAAGVASAAPAASSSRASTARSATFHGGATASMTANLDSSSEEEYAIKLDDLGPASQQTYATRNIFDDVDDDIVV